MTRKKNLRNQSSPKLGKSLLIVWKGVVSPFSSLPTRAEESVVVDQNVEGRNANWRIRDLPPELGKK